MSKSERRKQLEESLKKINKNFKDTLVQFADTKETKEKIPFGIEELDQFIGGGHQCGNFTVIYGGESVGKSTLVLQAIAHAQSLGKVCCYIDLEHSFEKERAEQLGINLGDLILAEQCQTAEQALEIIRTLCKDKVVDLFVVDSIQAMSPINEQENKGKLRQLEEKEIAELARLLSKFFKVSAPDVFRAKASVLMIGQVRIGGIGTFFTRATMTGGQAIRHWASSRLFIRRGQTADAPTEKYKETWIDPDGKQRYRTKSKQIGFDCVFKLEKTKSADSQKEGSEIHLPFYYDSGFKEPIINEELNIDANTEDGKKVLEDLKEIVEPKKKRGRPKKS